MQGECRELRVRFYAGVPPADAGAHARARSQGIAGIGGQRRGGAAAPNLKVKARGAS
jgi:hypothetical protein